MAGGNVSPRQKMINMMYLVLTAMLALNVSTEVLDAFTKIDIGLGKTARISIEKNENSITALAEAASENPEKAKVWHEKSLALKDKTNEIYNYIQDIKLELVRGVEGAKTESIVDGQIVSDKLKGLDNTSKGDEILLGSARNGKAYELRAKIQEYKDYLTSLINENNMSPSLIEEINGLLNFDVSKKAASDNRDWETFTFGSNPLIATLSMLSKQQVDVLNCETSILEALKSSVNAKDFKIKEIGVAVNNPSSVLMQGASSEAEIFLAAYDPTIMPIATYGGRQIQADANGKIKIKYTAGSALGAQSLRGKVEFTGPDGRKEVDFTIPYMVVEPSLVVSPTKMNVFYLGIDNPVDVSVSGYSDMNKVNVSIDNGTYSRSTNTIRPATAGKCFVSATVEGKTWRKEFRVKRVPDPKPAVHGLTSKTVSRGELAAAQGVTAQMPADFDFDLKFTVAGFTVSTVDGGFIKEERSTGQQFSPQQKTLIQNLKTNSTVFITDIKAKGPDGSTRDLSDMVIKVK